MDEKELYLLNKKIELAIDLKNKHLHQKVEQLEGEISELKQNMSRLQREASCVTPQPAMPTQQQAQPPQPQQPEPQQKLEKPIVQGSSGTARTGDYKSSDVSIEEFFYCGNKK
jgi:hypothetical protein